MTGMVYTRALYAVRMKDPIIGKALLLTDLSVCVNVCQLKRLEM